MSNQEQPQKKEWFDHCWESSKQLGVDAALSLSLEAADMVNMEIPSVFGQKWKNRIIRIHDELREEYGENLKDLFKLSLLLQEYAGVSAASFFSCYCESAATERVTGTIEELSTPDGYIESEGFSFVYMNAVSELDKPKELLSPTNFDAYPEDIHLFESMALICFFYAAQSWDRDEQKAFGWLCETSELLAYSTGWFMWSDSEKETKSHVKHELAKERGKKGAEARHLKAVLLKEIAHQAAEKNPGISANKLAAGLELQVFEMSRKVGYPLSEYNVRNTVANWIRQYRKRTPSS